MHSLIPAVFALVLLCLPGCKSQPAVDPEGVPCPGATAAQLAVDPPAGVLRGSVEMIAEVPEAQAFSLVSAVWAMATEAEEPVAGATVSLHRAGGLGQPEGQALLHTQTDASGRWCLGIPMATWQGKLVLLANHKGRQARLPVWWDFDLVLSAQSEAVVRVLESTQINPQAMTAELWLNLMTVADSRVGLLWPQGLEEPKTHQALVDQMTKELQADPRLLSLLEPVVSVVPGKQP